MIWRTICQVMHYYNKLHSQESQPVELVKEKVQKMVSIFN